MAHAKKELDAKQIELMRKSLQKLMSAGGDAGEKETEDEVKRLLSEIFSSTGYPGCNPVEDASVAIGLAMEKKPLALLCYEVASCGSAFPMGVLKQLVAGGTGSSGKKVSKQGLKGMTFIIESLKADKDLRERRPVMAAHNTLRGTLFSAQVYQSVAAGRCLDAAVNQVRGIEINLVKDAAKFAERVDSNILGWTKKGKATDSEGLSLMVKRDRHRVRLQWPSIDCSRLVGAGQMTLFGTNIW
eukprot:Skav217390  [mRNA]  locus=scaffold532:177123:177851:- [translate_table: standard]